MDSYAIVNASGRQLWVEENRFYDLNKLALQVGDTFSLNQILLVIWLEHFRPEMRFTNRKNNVFRPQCFRYLATG